MIKSQTIKLQNEQATSLAFEAHFAIHSDADHVDRNLSSHRLVNMLVPLNGAERRPLAWGLQSRPEISDSIQT
ncbi:hypothetical protein CGK93_09705 [Arthrobacter sp. YN]|nr:hypothetical protein CGK93_09705 [Arthrobacter sp. YN]